MEKEKNIWKEGILGVVIGDALGCPVQFETRDEVAEHPVTGERILLTSRPEWAADVPESVLLMDTD